MFSRVLNPNRLYLAENGSIVEPDQIKSINQAFKRALIEKYSYLKKFKNEFDVVTTHSSSPIIFRESLESAKNKILKQLIAQLEAKQKRALLSTLLIIGGGALLGLGLGALTLASFLTAGLFVIVPGMLLLPFLAHTGAYVLCGSVFSIFFHALSIGSSYLRDYRYFRDIKLWLKSKRSSNLNDHLELKLASNKNCFELKEMLASQELLSLEQGQEINQLYKKYRKLKHNHWENLAATEVCLIGFSLAICISALNPASFVLGLVIVGFATAILFALTFLCRSKRTDYCHKVALKPILNIESNARVLREIIEESQKEGNPVQERPETASPIANELNNAKLEGESKLDDNIPLR